MDYEKEYKGALARCKWLLSIGMISEIAATDMFRELMDNDSENIRKEIINIFHSLADGKIPVDINYADIFTWLENIPYTIDHEKREGFHLGYKTGLEKQGKKSLTVDIDSMVEAYEQRLISQGNGVRNSPIVNMCVAAFKHGVENTLDELHLKQGETSSVLSNSSNIGKDEQKPAWSEEDEHRVKDIVYFLDTAKKHYASTVELDTCIDWLKSLRPQKYRKPTKEQMDALLFVVQHYTPKVTDKLAWDSIKILELMYYEIKQ